MHGLRDTEILNRSTISGLLDQKRFIAVFQNNRVHAMTEYLAKFQVASCNTLSVIIRKPKFPKPVLLAEPVTGRPPKNNRGHPWDMTNECFKFQVDRIIRSEVIVRKPLAEENKSKIKKKNRTKGPAAYRRTL